MNDSLAAIPPIWYLSAPLLLYTSYNTKVAFCTADDIDSRQWLTTVSTWIRKVEIRIRDFHESTIPMFECLGSSHAILNMSHNKVNYQAGEKRSSRHVYVA